MAIQKLYRITLVSSIISFVFMFVAFASPFWYQSWRRVHSPFGNIGLWHVCLNGFIMPRDPIMKSYVGCWWIHSTEFSIIKDDLQPVWFRFVQGFSVLVLLMDLVALILVIIFFPAWRKPSWLKHRIRIFFITSGFMLVSAFLVFLISLVFAEMTNDSGWMPRPWMNYLSWSYGLCVVSGFFSAFGGMSIFVLALIYKDKQLNGDPDLDSAAEMAAKQRNLEKQDEKMRQQGGMVMEPMGQRTPQGSGQVYRPGQHYNPQGSGQVYRPGQPYNPHGSGQVYRPGQHHRPQAGYSDKPDFRKAGPADPPPYGSRDQFPAPPRSTTGSHASRADSQSARPSESFV